MRWKSGQTQWVREVWLSTQICSRHDDWSCIKCIDDPGSCGDCAQRISPFSRTRPPRRAHGCSPMCVVIVLTDMCRIVILYGFAKLTRCLSFSPSESRERSSRFRPWILLLFWSSCRTGWLQSYRAQVDVCLADYECTTGTCTTLFNHPLFPFPTSPLD